MRQDKQDAVLESPSMGKGPQSVGRVFSILEYLVANPDGATLSELANFADAPKTSLVGLLDALVAEGCIRKDDARRYLLGARIFTLAMHALAGRQLPDLAHPFLVELVATTGETAVLGVLSADGRHGVYIDKVESPRDIRYAVELGVLRDLHSTALGKVLLAGFDEKRLERFLSQASLKGHTPATVTSTDVLTTQIARVRQEGLARNMGERVRDVNGLAAPVYSGEGSIIAGVLLAGPAQRMEENQEANERALRRCAAGITEVIGGRTADL
jgi:DNA-binding IclR family transcriptional regulator